MEIKRVEETCIVCDSKLRHDYATSAHPEAPDMISLPHDAWVGVVRDEDGTTRLFYCCSRKCTTTLLTAEPDESGGENPLA